MDYLLVFIFILAVISDAIGDGLIDRHRRRSHITEFATIVAFIMAIGVSMSIIHTKLDFILYVVLMYPVQRLLFFDLFYNAIRELPISYVGHTDFLDRLIHKIRMPGGAWLFIKFIIWLGYTWGVLFNY